MVSTITRAELKAKLDRKEKLTLVEALPERYYLDKHLPGAINLPHDQVDALAPALLPDKSAQIVVYCASGRAATRASPRGGWPISATPTCATITRASRTGSKPACRSKAAGARDRRPPSAGAGKPSRIARDGAPLPQGAASPHPYSSPFFSMKAMWLS
jgi:hypothetical protein